MRYTIPVTELAKQLGDVLDHVCAGTTVTITRRHKPVVRIVPIADGTAPSHAEHGRDGLLVSLLDDALGQAVTAYATEHRLPVADAIRAILTATLLDTQPQPQSEADPAL